MAVFFIFKRQIDSAQIFSYNKKQLHHVELSVQNLPCLKLKPISRSLSFIFVDVVSSDSKHAPSSLTEEEQQTPTESSTQQILMVLIDALGDHLADLNAAQDAEKLGITDFLLELVEKDGWSLDISEQAAWALGRSFCQIDG